MADTSIRWATTNQLVALIRDASAATGVVVEPGWPGDQNVRPEMLWVDDITSTQEIPVMSGGRMHRDDFFTIRFLSRVAGRKTLDETMSRLDELAALIENPVADGPTLEDLDGVVSAEIATTDMTCGRTPDGCLGYGVHEVRVHSRLT